jgi:hypothetical protein
MADEQPIRAEAIPQTLSHLIQLNERYGVLIYLSNGCRYAVSPAAISDHLRRKHKVQLELRKQVDHYIKGFLFTYDYSIVPLPPDKSAPELVIDVVDGFRCKHCQQSPYKTQDRSNARKHENKVHNKKRATDEDLLNSVKLQSWFKGRKERYWVVDNSQ